MATKTKPAKKATGRANAYRKKTTEVKEGFEIENKNFERQTFTQAASAIRQLQSTDIADELEDAAGKNSFPALLAEKAAKQLECDGNPSTQWIINDLRKIK